MVRVDVKGVRRSESVVDGQGSKVSRVGNKGVGQII